MDRGRARGPTGSYSGNYEPATLMWTGEEHVDLQAHIAGTMNKQVDSFVCLVGTTYKDGGSGKRARHQGV